MQVCVCVCVCMYVRAHATHPQRQTPNPEAGGVSMLNAELAMAEALMGMGSWDYLINLSSSDLPVRSRRELVEYMRSQYGYNLINSWVQGQVGSMSGSARVCCEGFAGCGSGCRG
jgi:hypothetical protein